MNLTEQELREKIAELEKQVEEELLYEDDLSDEHGHKPKTPTRTAKHELAHCQALLRAVTARK